MACNPYLAATERISKNLKISELRRTWQTIEEDAVFLPDCTRTAPHWYRAFFRQVSDALVEEVRAADTLPTQISSALEFAEGERRAHLALHLRAADCAPIQQCKK